ncbi:hypothetical protein ACFYRN_42860 [Streptomyces sp. NPDC005227]|uniref:hypothetical protein n=1 Tax=Streptomyces sp. NPDC005227 TaxID=3364707 RepID=UPI0036AB916B
MSNSYAQPVLRTADLSESLRIVERLLAIADTSELEVDFEALVSSAAYLPTLEQMLPTAEWWAAGAGGSWGLVDSPPAHSVVRLRSWANPPVLVEPFLEAVGDSPTIVRWDFTGWPEAPEAGLGRGGTRGAFVTLCAYANDLELEEPAADHSVFVHVKEIDAERGLWLANQVGLRVLGDLVMAPY